MIPAPLQANAPRAGGTPPGILDPLHRLIACLREELQQYGGLLATLDYHPHPASASPTQELLQSAAAIRGQVAAIARVRSDRDRCHGAVARALGQRPAIPFATLIPLLPADYQPLVKALVQENSELQLRIQQRAQRNHVLMSRSAALMREFLSALPTLWDSEVR